MSVKNQKKNSNLPKKANIHSHQFLTKALGHELFLQHKAHLEEMAKKLGKSETPKKVRKYLVQIFSDLVLATEVSRSCIFEAAIECFSPLEEPNTLADCCLILSHFLRKGERYKLQMANDNDLLNEFALIMESDEVLEKTKLQIVGVIIDLNSDPIGIF